MKFLYEISKNSEETIESIQKEGIKPRERFGYRYVCLYPLLEQNGELINLWKPRYYDWVKPPVKDSIVVELPDDALVEFFIEDFAFGSADAAYRAKDIELILKEIYAYGKEHFKEPYKFQMEKYDEEGDAIEKEGGHELFDYCIEGIDSYAMQLDLLGFVCRYDNTIKPGNRIEPRIIAEKGANELKKIKKTYSIRFLKTAKNLGLEPIGPGPWYDREFTDVPFNAEKKMSTLAEASNIGMGLHAKLSSKYNRLTFSANKFVPSMIPMPPEIMLSAWSLASSSICISVDWSYYKKIDKLKSQLLNELWNRLKVPEQIPDWVEEYEKKHGCSDFFLKSSLERSVEDDEFIDACKEITEILKKT